MASWKKVVVSGSNASLAAISASNGLHVTGSILTSGSNDFDAITLFRKPVQVQAYTGNNLSTSLTSPALTVRSSGSAYALSVGNDTNVAGSIGGGIYISSGQYQTNPIINHFTYNGSNTFKVEASGNITSQGDLSIAGNTTLGNTTADSTQITGSTDISGSLRVDGTLTVTGDTLQEDLQTTGTTKLGNDMSDKTEITGSLNVTGSSIFDGTNAIVTIDPSSTTVLNIKDNGGSSTEALKLVKSNGVDMISLTNQGSENQFKMTDNGGNSILLSSKTWTNSYHLPNFAIGSNSADSNNTLSVTGNIKATTGITGSYLTDNKLLTAGSVGQIESSAITWDDTTLTVGSSGAGHVYATQVTASEVKISSLTADRIVFTNANNQLEDSSNLVYDDDGGLNVGGKLSLTGDLLVSHNLTVQGTASFQHTEDLDVADRFIRMASGSTSTGDGGIAVQQTGPTDTEGFGYDSGTSRWGVTSSFDASQNALVPVAFMPVAINGTDNNPTSNLVANETRYKKAGNIYIDTDATMEEGGVWIYV